MKKEYKVEINISDIKVDERYYSFEYQVSIDGIYRARTRYKNDYDNGDTKEEWKNYLETSEYCLGRVLEELSEEF